MLNWIILTAVVITVIFLMVLYAPKNRLESIDVESIPIIGNVLGKKSKSLELEVEDPVLPIKQRSKKVVTDTVQTSADNLNQIIDNSSKSIISSVLGTESSSQVSVKISDSSLLSNSYKQFTLDLKSEGPINLKLQKNSKYQLKLENVPSGFCLFVGSQSYSVSSDQIVEIEFNASGNFPIKMDYCQPTSKNLGQFEVE